jgi:N6-L-threonylcarbamoyladenine synthase
MRILGIETSCDETSVAVVEDGVCVRCNVIATSKSATQSLAGVIPEEAARAQVECMMPVVQKAFGDAGVSVADIDAIAVTRGPGLLGSLLVGTTAARFLASVWKKPLIGVHHTLGHLSSTWLETDDVPVFPLLTLSASGGHTDLWYRTSHTRGSLLGRTRDDAAGEAFDKGASMLGLSYPGGPSIAKAADGGDEHRHVFPLPLKGEDTLDFSFSGLKTSLKYLLRDLRWEDCASEERAKLLPDLAASFQYAICMHLVDGIQRALRRHPDAKEVHIVGGVSANTRLRSLVASACPHIRMRAPKTLAYCTDNAAMIAAAAAFLANERSDAACARFDTQASLSLRETVMP